jgi:cGMP-dependent protein kinase
LTVDLLDNDQSRYYIGSILLAIEYLHSKNIIYRDLKPENIMVDKKGVLKVVDMGTAKILRQEDGMKTFTILGTPHYMAPEILVSKGYGLNADLWSIGKQVLTRNYLV